MMGLLIFGFNKHTETTNAVLSEQPEKQKMDYKKKQQWKFKHEWKQEFKCLEMAHVKM